MADGRERSEEKESERRSGEWLRDEGGKKEFTNYKMQLSAFVRGVSRSVEAVPAFEWVAKLLYRVCNLSSTKPVISYLAAYRVYLGVATRSSPLR